MRLKRRGDVLARGRRILFAKPDGAHRDSRNAESALHAAALHERLGNLPPMRLVEAFQCGDRLAFGLCRRKRACQHRLASQEHRAATALCLWLAAVFWRSNAQKIAQHIQQRQFGIVGQFKLNPAPPDPMQAKIFALMPIIMTVMMAWFPAGLVLYWLTNTLLSIAQQWNINRVVELEAKKRGG